MTPEQVLSSERREKSPETPACSHCRRRLSNEYYFTCRKCGASCCYIHMRNHRPQKCSARQNLRGRRRAWKNPAEISSANV